MQEISKSELYDISGGGVVLDIGAFDCKDSNEFAEMGATVYAFEPVHLPVGLHKNVAFFPYAVGAADKITVINTSPHAQSNSIRKPKTHLELFPNVPYTGRVSVEMVRLDTWYKGISRLKRMSEIALIWADVNGCEGDLIAGAGEVLKRTKYLFIETSDKELFEGQITTDELIKLLPGWEVLGMYNHLGNFGNILMKNGNTI